MTNAQKLEALIQKAAGYDKNKPHFAHPLEEYEYSEQDMSWHRANDRIGLFEIIYQHSFARALFGEECHFCHLNVQHSGVDHDLISEFEYHLQQAVISDNPIDYYYEQVFGKV